jgi:hypothetical protein
MKGTDILINGNQPNGRFEEGTLVLGLAAACYAGMAMELVPATEPTNGRYSWQPVQTGAASLSRPLVIVLGDTMEGYAPMNAYTGSPNALQAGYQIFLYWPMHGDEMNLLVENITGTSDHFAIGDKLMIDPTSTGYGKWVKQVSTDPAPAMVEETIAAGITIDTYVACKIW